MDRIPRSTRYKTVEIILPDRLFIDIWRASAASQAARYCVVVLRHGMPSRKPSARDRIMLAAAFASFFLPFVFLDETSTRVTSCYGVPLIALRDASKIRLAPASSAFSRRGFAIEPGKLASLIFPNTARSLVLDIHIWIIS